MACEYTDHKVQINYFPKHGIAQLWMEGDLINTFDMYDVEAMRAKNMDLTCVHCKEKLIIDFQTRNG